MPYDNDANMASADITNRDNAELIIDAFDNVVDAVFSKIDGDGTPIYEQQGFDDAVANISSKTTDIARGVIDIYQMLEQGENARVFIDKLGNTGFVFSTSLSSWNLDQEGRDNFTEDIANAIRAAFSDGGYGPNIATNSNVGQYISGDDSSSGQISHARHSRARQDRESLPSPTKSLREIRLKREAAETEEYQRIASELLFDELSEAGALPEGAVLEEYNYRDLKSIAIDFMRPENNAAEAAAQRSRYLSTGGYLDTIGDIGKSIDTGLGQVTRGNSTGALKTFGNIIGSAGEDGAMGSGLFGLFESLGLDTAMLGSISSVLTTAIPIAAATMFAINAAGGLIDAERNARLSGQQQGFSGFEAYTVGAGMSAQRALDAFATGLSDKEIKSIQDTLINNQAEYGSEEYNRGYRWAVDAAQNRGLSAQQAADYYTDLVVKGGASMQELNDAMDTLSETTKNTSLGMKEVSENITNMSRTLSGAYGGNALLGQQAAFNVQDYFTTGSGQGGLMATGVVGKFDFTNDVRAIQAVDSILEQNPDMGYDEAVVMASFQMASQGYLPGANDFFYRPLTAGGKRFFEYLQERDFDGLRDALESVWNYDGDAYGNMGRGKLIAAMKSIGVPDERMTSVDSLMEYLQYDVSGGLSDMASGASSAVKQADLADRQSGNWFQMGFSSPDSASRELQEAIDSGSASGQANASDIMAVLSGAGIYDSSIKLTESGAQAASDRLLEMYLNDGNGLSFEEWVNSSSGSSAASSVIERYANLNSPEAPSTNVNVQIEMVGEARRMFFATWQEGYEQEQRDSGYSGN